MSINYNYQYFQFNLVYLNYIVFAPPNQFKVSIFTIAKFSTIQVLSDIIDWLLCNAQ